MSDISRSDVYLRGENGPEWFQELLKSLAENKEGGSQDVMKAIYDRGSTVQSVVDNYKEMVGLDSLANNEPECEIKSSASRMLSKRCAAPEQPDILVVIEKAPEIQKDLHSLCQHSGGTKNTHAIISFLRDKMGSDLVSYSNQDLVKYIEDIKGQYKEHDGHNCEYEVGAVGIENSDNLDDAAEYTTHGQGK